MLGEPTQVVKEFTEILTREEKKVFIHFPREERGQMHRVASAPKCVGVSLLLGFKGQVAGKSGGFMSVLVLSSTRAGCVSIGRGFLENRLAVFSNLPVLGCLKET